MFELIKSVCDVISVVVFVVINVTIVIYFLKMFLSLIQRGEVKGGYVLVTGCDSGFGYATAIELSRRKSFVFAGCLTKDGVDILQNDPTFNGRSFIMDVTKQKDIENAKLIIENEAKGKGLWALVNNAGIFQIGQIEWQSVELMQNTMDVNLWGAVRVTKAMLPLVKEARGRVVNVGSIGGRVLLANGTSYSMSKYAIEAFSDGLRYEMKPWDVSVHIIEPGIFQTNLTNKSRMQQVWRKLWEAQPEEIKQSYGEDYYKRVVSMTEDMVDVLGSPNINKVPNAVCHAVLSSSPKPRYVVGFDANTLWMAIAILPTSIGDFLTNAVAKLEIPSARKI